MDKNTLPDSQKPKCEMCGNEALPLHTLCQAHLEVRMAEQMKGKEFVNNPASGHSSSLR